MLVQGLLLLLRRLWRVDCWSEFVLRCVVLVVLRGVLLFAPAAWWLELGRLLLWCYGPGPFGTPGPARPLWLLLGLMGWLPSSVRVLIQSFEEASLPMW